MVFTSHSLEDTKKFATTWVAETIAKRASAASIDSSGTNKAFVVGLYGDLGSGKTAFTQAVAQALGINEPITSPTFVIEKVYPLKNTTFTHLIHIDAYRLDTPQELARLGWGEIISNPDNIILIEWPEKVASIMPADHTRLKFTFIDENTRTIESL